MLQSDQMYPFGADYAEEANPEYYMAEDGEGGEAASLAGTFAGQPNIGMFSIPGGLQPDQSPAMGVHNNLNYKHVTGMNAT